MRAPPVVLILALLGGAGADARAQSAGRDSVVAHRTAERLHLDGRLDEAAWQRADSLTTFTQQDPVEGAPSPERTVVRFVATGAGLWVGFEAYDRNPAGIRHAQLRGTSLEVSGEVRAARPSSRAATTSRAPSASAPAGSPPGLPACVSTSRPRRGSPPPCSCNGTTSRTG